MNILKKNFLKINKNKKSLIKQDRATIEKDSNPGNHENIVYDVLPGNRIEQSYHRKETNPNNHENVAYDVLPWNRIEQSYHRKGNYLSQP